MKQEIQDKLHITNIEKRILLPESAALVKLEAALIKGAQKYCESQKYQLIPIPHITKATGACENFNTLFKTDMFTDSAYLNQTGQLLLEAFMDKFEKTYCVGPSFRKENKADPRHLAEFTLFEIEVANISLNELQYELSNIFRSMLDTVRDECLKDLEHLVGIEVMSWLDNLTPEEGKSYKAITYKEALSWLPEFNLKFGDDLKSDHEQKLVQINDMQPLFVTHYPKEIKFFNMRENRDDPTIVNSMDLLLPISGESVGAAEREEDWKRLHARLEESDMLRLLKIAIKLECGFDNCTDQELHTEAMNRFNWYLDVIKHYPIEHSGAGIGISRISQSILRVQDIRKAVAFPINRETLF